MRKVWITGPYGVPVCKKNVKCLHFRGIPPLAIPLFGAIWIQERAFQSTIGEFYSASRSEDRCKLVCWEQVGAFLGMGMLVAGRSLAVSR